MPSAQYHADKIDKIEIGLAKWVEEYEQYITSTSLFIVTNLMGQLSNSTEFITSTMNHGYLFAPFRYTLSFILPITSVLQALFGVTGHLQWSASADHCCLLSKARNTLIQALLIVFGTLHSSTN
jgi:hypothetical protein